MRLLILNLVALFFHNAAYACFCAAVPVEEAFRSAEIVFEGTVIGHRMEELGASEDGSYSDFYRLHIYTQFQVENVHKGDVGKTIEVLTSTGTSCSIGFSVGERVRLYPYTSEGKHYASFCTRTDYLTAKGGISKLPDLLDTYCEVEKNNKSLSRYDIEHFFEKRASENFLEEYLQAVAVKDWHFEDPLQEVFASLETAIEFHDPIRTRNIIELILSSDPLNARALVEYGRFSLRQGDKNLAKEVLNRVADLKNKNLDVITVENHLQLLVNQQIIKKFVDFRDIEINTPVVASNKNIKGADFGRSKLSEVDFSNSNLEHSNFSPTKIFRANFTNANLKSSALEFLGYGDSEATGEPSMNFSGANLSNAILRSFAWSININFSNAVLKYVNAIEGQFSKGNFTNADLTSAVFENAKLNRAVFSGAILTKTNFTGATFYHAKLQDTDLRRAILNNVKFEGARINCKTKLPKGFDVIEAKLIPVEPICKGKKQNRNFSGTSWGSVDFSNLDLSGADFSKASMGGAWFQNSNLTSSNFSDLRGAHIRFHGADLTRAKFTEGNFKAGFGSARPNEFGDMLNRAILTETDFSGAKLSSDSFISHTINGPKFDLDLSTAIFKNTTMTCQGDLYRREIQEARAFLNIPEDEREDWQDKYYVANQKQKLTVAGDSLAAEVELIYFLSTKWPSMNFDMQCWSEANPNIGVLKLPTRQAAPKYDTN